MDLNTLPKNWWKITNITDLREFYAALSEGQQSSQARAHLAGRQGDTFTFYIHKENHQAFGTTPHIDMNGGVYGKVHPAPEHFEYWKPDARLRTIYE